MHIYIYTHYNAYLSMLKKYIIQHLQHLCIVHQQRRMTKMMLITKRLPMVIVVLPISPREIYGFTVVL